MTSPVPISAPYSAPSSGGVTAPVTSTFIMPLAASGSIVATGNSAVLRDGAGRTKMTDPSVAADVATKNYVDNADQTIAGTYKVVANSTARLALSPYTGLHVLQSDTGDIWVYRSSTWWVLAKAGNQTWLTISKTAGWTDYGSGFNSGQYTKDSEGWVRCRGLITNVGGASMAAGYNVATLPVGYRPAATVAFVSDVGGMLARIDVGATGAIGYAFGTNSPTSPFVFLDGINFYAGF